MPYAVITDEVRAKRAAAQRRRMAADPAKRAAQLARTRAWRAANADKVREGKRKWEAANPEKKRAYDRRSRTKNADKYRSPKPCFSCGGPKPRGRGVYFCEPCAEQRRETRNAAKNRRWLERNRDKANAKNALRHAAKLRATPLWLTDRQRDEIRTWYALAQATGLEVDHIVPLRGETVSGLHVPWNLQLLPEFENIAKKNKLTEAAYS